MADEATTSTPPESQGPSKVDQTLEEMKNLLKAQNDAFASQLQQITQAIQRPPQQTQTQQRASASIDDSDFLDPRAMQSKIDRRAEDIAMRALAKERELNATIGRYALDYPEIQTDDKVKKAVIDAHNSLPENMRDSAAGYETAILRTVTKEGLVQKSKRQAPVEDAPVARGTGKGQSKGDKKAKVDERSIEFARLLGRPVDDPNYIKELEKTAARSEEGTWGKYR